MYEKQIVVTHDAGMHARPATMLVNIARKYENCEVRVVKAGDEADAKSIMTVLALGISAGTTLNIKAWGEKEAEVVERIYTLIETDFDKEKNPI